MPCTRYRYEVILKGLPSKAIKLYTAGTPEMVLKKAALLRVTDNPQLYIRTYLGKSRKCTVKPFMIWRRYNGDGK